MIRVKLYLNLLQYFTEKNCDTFKSFFLNYIALFQIHQIFKPLISSYFISFALLFYVIQNLQISKIKEVRQYTKIPSYDGSNFDQIILKFSMCLQQFIQCQYYINIHIMNKDQVLYQLVEKQFNRQREMFEFETVEIIINKVPKSRIIKENTQLIFDQIKHSVQNSISKQQFRRVKKIEENKMIKAINFKLSKAITQTIIDNQQLITKQKLRSKFGIQKSLRYLKHQEGLKLEARLGQPKSSYSQVQYVKISNNDRFQHTKIFMREAEIRNLDIDFKNDYVLEFKNNLLPNEFQITKRAQVLAKLYLLDLYKNQVPNMENQLKLQEQQRLKQHQLQKIKKKVEEEIQVNSALKQQQVNDNDLMKQVKKIESLLQKKMNNLAYENFNNKKFEQSVLVKKSLEKLKKMVKEIPLAVNKLKFLIKYKQDKNY